VPRMRLQSAFCETNDIVTWPNPLKLEMVEIREAEALEIKTA